MFRYYIVPEIGGGAPLNSTTPDALRPKYFGDMSGIAWASMPFGLEGVRIVGCALSDFDHAFVASKPDAVILPSDLTGVLDAAAASALQTQLETKNIPAQWVAAGMTYGQVLRKVVHIFQFMQRLNGHAGMSRLLANGVTLDSPFNGIPGAAKNKLKTAAQSFGWDTSGFTPGSTMRQILKAAADQWVGPVFCGDAEIR